jgi:hypothetical protein
MKAFGATEGLMRHLANVVGLGIVLRRARHLPKGRELPPRRLAATRATEDVPGATHKFDAAEPGHVFKDPAANLGRGGEVRVVPNPAAAEMAREATARFFVEVFGRGQ